MTSLLLSLLLYNDYLSEWVIVV